jgi:hypothetical protein
VSCPATGLPVRTPVDADCALFLPSAVAAAARRAFAALSLLGPTRPLQLRELAARDTRGHNTCPLRPPPNAPSATPARRESHPPPPRAPPIGAFLSSFIATSAPLTRAPGLFAPPGNVLCACASRPDHVKWWHWERHHGPIRDH